MSRDKPNLAADLKAFATIREATGCSMMTAAAVFRELNDVPKTIEQIANLDGPYRGPGLAVEAWVLRRRVAKLEKRVEELTRLLPDAK